MAEKQTTGTSEGKSLSPLEAYNIILQRHASEDRILTERVTVFLGASSILFLAFVMLLNTDLAPSFRWLRIVLPLVGIFMTCFLYSSCRAAANAIAFWHGAEGKIESETPEFSYLREKHIAPHTCVRDVISGAKKWVNTGESLSLEDTRGWSRWLRNPYFRPGSNFNLTQGLVLPLFSLFFILWLASLILAIIR